MLIPILTLVLFAAYSQVKQYDFVTLDDNKYVTENAHVQAGITSAGVCWAFSTTHAQYWHPLTWLSLMFDYELFGMNAGGYHVINLILHLLSTLLLFWLFNRCTGAIWRSAFVAALFALHPVNVESVAWISKRRDLLCVFFSMLSLCLYVYYTEKPDVKRYMASVLCFIFAMMCKPMVVTLPLVMIILDYWPLKRFELKKENIFLWQFKEKTPFFILSAVFSVIAVYAHDDPAMFHFSLKSRIANAAYSFMIYLRNIFWPHDMIVLRYFSDQLPVLQVAAAILLIAVISFMVFAAAKRFPYLLVGWLWYSITILPMLGVVQFGHLAMSDHHAYFPSIGIYIGIAWGVPLLFPRKDLRKKILFPAATAIIAVLAFLTWLQCSYWKNSIELFSHSLKVMKNNFLAYNNRGMAYGQLGDSVKAIDDFNHAIIIRPYYYQAYYNRGVSYDSIAQYQRAIDDYTSAIKYKPGTAVFFHNRAITYFKQGNKSMCCHDIKKACEFGDCRLFNIIKEKKYCR